MLRFMMDPQFSEAFMDSLLWMGDARFIVAGILKVVIMLSGALVIASPVLIGVRGLIEQLFVSTLSPAELRLYQRRKIKKQLSRSRLIRPAKAYKGGSFNWTKASRRNFSWRRKP